MWLVRKLEISYRDFTTGSQCFSDAPRKTLHCSYRAIAQPTSSFPSVLSSSPCAFSFLPSLPPSLRINRHGQDVTRREHFEPPCVICFVFLISAETGNDLHGVGARLALTYRVAGQAPSPTGIRPAVLASFIGTSAFRFDVVMLRGL